MRCKYCGSKAIYPSKNHEQASAGRVIAGAVIAGPVGAMVGLAGKNVNGYRCSTCGSFSAEPMSVSEEMLINSAINEAKTKGSSISYERCAEKYRGIEYVATRATSVPDYPSAPVVKTYDPLPDAKPKTIEEPQKHTVKYSYSPSTYTQNSPVLIKAVVVETDGYSDILRMTIRNVSDKSLRSVYFKVFIYDDVGDLISECSYVYQGLVVKSGEYLPEDKTFELKTDLAYKVVVTCEKAAFTDDSVWRQEAHPVEYALPELIEMTPWHFRPYKYLLGLFKQRCKPEFEGKLYMPAFEDEYRMCVCGRPVSNDEVCPLCGLDEAALREIMDYDNLAAYRRTQIKQLASSRTEGVQKLYHQAQEAKYNEALLLKQKATKSDIAAAIELFQMLAGYKDSRKLIKECQTELDNFSKKEIYNEAAALMAKRPQSIKNYEKAIEKLNSIASWKDSKEQLSICQQQIEMLNAKAEADRIERERQAEIAKQESAAAAKKRKTRNIVLAICAALLTAAGVFIYLLFTSIIPHNQYNAGLNLLSAGKYDEAYAIFESLGDYSDSAEQCKEARYQHALSLWEKNDFEASNPIFKQLGSYKDSRKRIHTHKYTSEITIAPACETNGEEKFTCEHCPHSYTESIDATGHSYSEAKITKNPTCTEQGEKQAYCTACSNTITESVPIVDHSYTSKITTAVTCEKDGVKTFSCKCGESYTEKIKATGHNYDKGVVTTKATCEKDGVKTFSCKCGKSYTETIKATGHDYSTATCTTASICSNCKHIKQAALGHDNQNNKCSRCNKNLSGTFSIIIDTAGENHFFMGKLNDYTPASGQYQVSVTVLAINDAYDFYEPSFSIKGTSGILARSYSSVQVGETYTGTIKTNETNNFRCEIQYCKIKITIEPL